MIPKAFSILFLSVVLFLHLNAQHGDNAGREVWVQPDSMKLYGTLLVPAKGFTGDAVLLIAGSGPTDRDGNQQQLRSNAYKQLADSLALHGIASLRYDKRFIGKSMGRINEQHLRFEDNVVVANAFYQLLKKEPGVNRLFIAGHSEGSTVGMLLTKEVQPEGFISLAGPSLPADSLLRMQLNNLPEQLKTEAFAGLDSLRAGKLVPKPSLMLYSLLRPSVQPYLISWFRYDPRVLMSTLKTSVLVVQGTTDLQVPVQNGNTLAAAAKKARLAVIEGMNHVLKVAPSAPAANAATYNQPDLPLAPGLVGALLSFIRNHK